MGNIIPARRFLGENQQGLLKPIIYCGPPEEITNRAVSLNRELALELSKYKPNRRTMQIERCFLSAIEKLPEDSIIKEFDVLFHPDYKIDILRLMIGVCKSKQFSMIWPGSFDGEYLIYAEEGYADYKIFSVSDYDITCVVWGGREQ